MSKTATDLGTDGRRPLPPPWSVDETMACFVVKDHSGQKLAYVYFEQEPGQRSAAGLLTKRTPVLARFAGRYYGRKALWRVLAISLARGRARGRCVGRLLAAGGLHRWGYSVAAYERHRPFPGSVRLLRPCRDEYLGARF